MFESCMDNNCVDISGAHVSIRWYQAYNNINPDDLSPAHARFRKNQMYRNLIDAGFSKSFAWNIVYA